MNLARVIEFDIEPDLIRLAFAWYGYGCNSQCIGEVALCKLDGLTRAQLELIAGGLDLGGGVFGYRHVWIVPT